MKKTLSLLLAITLCLSLSVLFTACGHEHAYATDWSKDDTHHWHACTKKNCTESTDKAEHEWDTGVVTTLATYAADGTKTFTCTTCAATKTEPYAVDTTVTQAEWDAALAFTDNFTMTLTLTSPADPNQAPFVYLLTRNGDTFCQVTDGDNGDYWTVKNGVCYAYSQVSGGHKETVMTQQTPETLTAYCTSRLLTSSFRNYYPFLAYDEESRTYRTDELTYTSLTDIAVAFEDGKLVWHTYTESDLGVVATVTVTYGTAGEITLPTNIVTP